MSQQYDLYVSDEQDMDKLAEQLAEVLEIEWEAKYSSFFGDYFKFNEATGGNLTLKSNYYAETDDWLEPEYQLYPCLFYVNNSCNADSIQGLIEISNLPLYFMIRKNS